MTNDSAASERRCSWPNALDESEVAHHPRPDAVPMQHATWNLASAQQLVASEDIRWFAVRAPHRAERAVPMVRTGGLINRLCLPGAAETGEPHDLPLMSHAALDQLLRQLANQPLPILLPRVPAYSPTIPGLRGAFSGRGVLRVSEALGTPCIKLDASWVEPSCRFNPGRQSDFRRAQRHAEKLGALSFEVHESPTGSELDRLLDEAYVVESLSWKGGARTALAEDSRLGPFFRRYAHAAAEAGILRLAFMRVGGRAVGMQIAVEWQRSFWLLKIGYDAEYARCSPGNLLMLHTIAYAARRGLVAYEFLGDPAPWTAQWTQTLRPCVCVRAYPFSVPGGLALLQDAFSALMIRARRLRRRLFTGARR